MTEYDPGSDPNKTGHIYTKAYKQKVRDYFAAHENDLRATLRWIRETYPKMNKDVVRAWVDEVFRAELNGRRDRLNERWMQKYPGRYEAICAKGEERDKARRVANKEQYYAEARRWRSENTEHLRDYDRRKWQEDKQKILEQTRERKRQDPEFKLLENTRCYIWQQLRKALKSEGSFTKPEATCDLLGCTPREYLNHLRSLYKPGMTGENYGKWHVDHIRPCSSFNLSDEGERRKCFHYTNTQPLWAKENISKGNKILPS